MQNFQLGKIEIVVYVWVLTQIFGNF